MEAQSILCSVIITAYNYGSYLKRAIDSVVSQDFDHHEIIVVDDGSDDETRTIAKSYGDRIRYVHQEHSGPFIAARTGFRHARGRYIVFVDADDRLRPNALRNLHEVAVANPAAAIVLGKICAIDESRGTVAYENGIELSEGNVDNFARFCRGELKSPIAGSFIEASLLQKFDRDPFEYPSSMDLVIFGLGLLTGCVQADHHTLDVFAHEARLRDDINYIHRSGARLVDILFDESILPRDCLKYRQAFLGFIERERTRSYYRAGWHSLSWRSYCRAITAAPASLLHARSLRRFIVSFIFSALRKDEGPVASPPPHWLFGHHRDFYKDPIGFTAQAIDRFRTNIRLNLQERTYVLVRAQDVDHVLRRNPYNYQPAGISRIVPAFAGAVLGTPHPEHEPLRRWLAPFFRPNELAAWVAVVSEILERRASDIPVRTPFDIAPVMRSINFEIACRIVVGTMSPQEMNRLDHLILKSHSYSTRVLRSFLRLPRWVPLRSHRVVGTVEREIDTIFNSLVSRNSTNKPPSILDQMLAERSRGQGRPLKDLRYTTAGLLLAACEPVAVTTTMSLHLLGRDPVLQNRIVDELAKVQGKLGAAPISLPDLREFVLLNAFIDEVHRLYPAEWLLTREATQMERLPSGLLVRGGDQVMIDLNCLHRSADSFPDPDRCDPDRFRQSGMKSNGSYLPFGAGATTCLGQSLARLIILMSLVTILTKWRVESLEASIELDSLNCFSIAPKGPVSVSLHERDAASRGPNTATPGHTVSCPYADGAPQAPA